MFESSLNNALTRGNSSEITGYFMPSSSYENLTIGASGTEYIAPANGFFYTENIPTSNGGYVSLYNSTADINSPIIRAANSGAPWFSRTFIFASKGDVVKLDYGASNISFLHFIYSKGSESEA